MPRYARIHVTGGLFHVISRFHDKQYFLDIGGARHKYLQLLGNAAGKHDSRIIAYCLMSTHVHLVLQLGNDPLGAFTKAIHAPFAVWVNKRRGGLGTVLADRPKSVIVHAETHGMELLRYVHNNPVRAGLVERASESVWSSHQAYLGLDECPPWLAVEAVFGEEGGDRERIRKDLDAFVDEGRGEARRPEFSGEVSRELAGRIRGLIGGPVELSSPVLGPDDFVREALKEQVVRHKGRRLSAAIDLSVEEVTSRVFEKLGMGPELARARTRRSDVARGRALVAWLWVELLGRSQVSAAQGLNLRPHSVSDMLGKLKRTGLGAGEAALLEGVLEVVAGAGGAGEVSGDQGRGAGRVSQPKVFVLKRRR
jgi:REP element-mobilizing transposase RayT